MAANLRSPGTKDKGKVNRIQKIKYKKTTKRDIHQGKKPVFEKYRLEENNVE